LWVRTFRDLPAYFGERNVFVIFSHIERELAARGRSPRDSSQAEMDRIWDEAKKQEGMK
jgi:hypothetical protein